MSRWFYEQVAKARDEITRNPRKCEICGETETVDNVMLKYKNGMILCDDCAFRIYDNNTENEDEKVTQNPRTCKECNNFIGLGDFALCCKAKYGLCYEDTPVCKQFKQKENE